MAEQIIRFQHRNEELPFHYDKDTGIIANGNKKRIYRGYFEGKTPSADIGVDEICTLVEITISNNPPSHYIPQERLYHDLLDFPDSTHLRRILAWDTDAELVRYAVEAKMKPRLPEGGLTCYTVQPLYFRSRDAMKSATMFERLELLLQVIYGLEELQAYGYVAHRDIKLENIMILPGDKSFTAVLIDFASLRNNISNGTIPYPMSYANTAPEDVDFMKKPIGEKVDVFALGGIIGELFGKKNPISAWQKGLALSSDERRVRQLLAEYERIYCSEMGRSGNEGWLRQELRKAGDPFEWKKELCTKAASNLRKTLDRLLRVTTEINPDDRLSLKELKGELLKLCGSVGESRNANNLNLYNVGESARRTVSARPEAQELCVCLFDMSDYQYIPSYCTAVRDNIPESTNLRFFSYIRQSQATREGSLGFGGAACKDLDELCRYINTEQSRLKPHRRDVSPAGADGLACCLMTLCEDIGKDGFSGRVTLNIFSPNLPDEKNSAPYRDFGLRRTLRCLEKVCGGLDVTVYSRRKPSLETDAWYAWYPLEKGGAASYLHGSATKEQKVYMSNPGALYIETSDGRSLFVGRKREGGGR